VSRATTWLAWLLALAVLPSLMPNPYVQYVVNSSLILAFATIGLNLIFGYAGQHAFGFPVFFGVGAYASALLSIDAGLPVGLAIPIGALVTGAISTVIGFPSFRLRGIYFGVATIAFSYVIYIVAQNWVGLTRGPMGIPLIPRLHLLPNHATFGVNRDVQTRIAVMITIAAVIVVLDRLLRSPIGRAWLAIRENENLASSLGISPLRYQMAAFVLGAVISGLGGGFYAHYVGFVSPTELGFHYIGVVFIMLIAGGTSTLAGPLIGSVVFGVLPELLRVAEMARNLLLGTILLLCIIAVPEGLAGIWKRLKAARVTHERSPAVAQTPRAASASVDEIAHIAPTFSTSGSLEVRTISKQFDGLTALEDVSFTVQPGEVVGLIGPNGAGKTTLFNIITGVLPPTAGNVFYCGRKIGGLTPHAIAALGITRTYQITSIFPELTAAENVRVATHVWSCHDPFATLLRSERYRKAEAAVDRTADLALALVNLQADGDIPAVALSYGDQRRLEVAVALATGARLILLDEPAAGLNAEETEELCALIRRLRAAGFTVIIIEHDMRMVMTLCDRIIVLSYGRKIFDGAPQEAAIHPEVVDAYLGAGTTNA
jgi:branched-chain amino acid transport system ATP-binding protein/branched-chain amino acid transport system permease protein